MSTLSISIWSPLGSWIFCTKKLPNPVTSFFYLWEIWRKTRWDMQKPFDKCDIYHIFAEALLSISSSYPCFCLNDYGNSWQNLKIISAVWRGRFLSTVDVWWRFVGLMMSMQHIMFLSMWKTKGRIIWIDDFCCCWLVSSKLPRLAVNKYHPFEIGLCPCPLSGLECWSNFCSASAGPQPKTTSCCCMFNWALKREMVGEVIWGMILPTYNMGL